jgi:hypothetical protein
MQPKKEIADKRSKSRCMYCNQLSWGKGCRYAPHGVHFHADVPTLCAYCGNPAYGVGCHLNPIGNIHIHGINYNSMIREQIQGFLTSKVLLNELQKSYTEFECYKLGIIDDKGNRIKSPVTEQEQASFTPIIKTILTLKRYLGSKVELINATNSLDKETIPVKENIETYKRALLYKDKIEANINELYRILDEAHASGISLEEIQKFIKS